MPEDQGQNGDRWTEEASRLLHRMGWEKVADSNIDIKGTDGLQHGIDALFTYDAGLDLSRREGVFLEAKRYQTSSFRPDKLSDWVAKLDEKMLQLRVSEDFHSTYPRMREANPRNALLMIWFHDLANYPALASRLGEHMVSMHVPTRRRVNPNRLHILHNEGILRLASLVQAKRDLEEELQCTDPGLRFYYPSRQRHGFPARDQAHLSLDYAFSDIVMARLPLTPAPRTAKQGVDVAFLHGGYNLQCFQRLKQALLLYGMLNSGNILYILHRADLDQLRKIEPDIRKLFRVDVRLTPMTSYADLPPWMLKGGH